MARLPITTITKTSTSEVTLNYLTAVNGTPAADQFRSTITGRSKMIDFSTDMLPRMGVERIPVQSIMRVDGEVGPAGETVFKPVNDKYDQIRFVGGGWTNNNTGYGALPRTSVNTDYMEMTFYGTGLNLLQIGGSQDGNFTYNLDGGSAVTVTLVGTTSPIQNRNYANNQITAIVSGLTLGTHTVKINNTTGGISPYGFEILNESSSIKVGAGQVVANGVARTIAAHTSAYNSGFESGTLGTRGGRVLVYAKRDGTIGKAVTPVDAASLTLTNANHANEEVIRNYFWREFGCGRTDDWSTLTTSPNRASVFTLDDGTTTLVASSVRQYVETAGLREGITVSSVGEFITFTFVGTGVDVTQERQNIATTTYNVILDGVTIASAVAGSTLFGTTPRVNKIVSGLPYGTHTLKIQVAASGTDCTFGSFIVYGPKKPTIPAGAMELADYNVMADYVPVSAGDIQGSVAQGVLRKHGIREAVYSGTWAATGLDATYEGGIYIAATANASYVEYTFWGTGFDLRCGSASNGDPASQLTLDGSTNFSAYTTSFYGTGMNFTAATGVLDQLGSNTNGTGVSVRGLTLGKHVIRTTKTSGTFIYAFAIDVITPIHTHKNNGPFVLQNTLSVGSQGINDGRKFGSQLAIPLPSSSSIGVGSSTTTTSASYAPSGDTMMSTVSLEEDADVLMLINSAARNSTVNVGISVVFFVDGQQSGIAGYFEQQATTGNYTHFSTSHIAKMSKGTHHIAVMYRTSGGTATIYHAQSNLAVTVKPKR